MRHGRTLFNVMGLNQGMGDSPLTKEGIEETLKTKEWFIDNKVAFDSVYASTLKEPVIRRNLSLICLIKDIKV